MYLNVQLMAQYAKMKQICWNIRKKYMELKKEQRKLNILYCGNFNPTSVGEPEIAWALEKLGHRVDRLDEAPNVLGEVYKRLAKRNEYDLLLFAKFRVSNNPADVKEFLTRTTKTLKVPTVCWLFDLYWGYRREAEIKVNMLPAFSADIVFTTDGGHDYMWKRYGI